MVEACYLLVLRREGGQRRGRSIAQGWGRRSIVEDAWVTSLRWQGGDHANAALKWVRACCVRAGCLVSWSYSVATRERRGTET